MKPLRTIGQGVLLGLGAFCAFSCSVREDRSNCPCSLALDLREVPSTLPADTFPLRWSVLQGDYTESGTLAAEDCDDLLRISVPRGGVRVYAAAGDEGLFWEGLEIPPGRGCPPVYFWCAALDAGGETAAATVRIRKAFCSLTVLLKGTPGPRDYRLLFTGNVAGYDGAGRPLPGTFRCVGDPQETEEGRRLVSVGLPRQTDNSLLMQVFDADAGTDAAPLRTFALGNAIAASGYDWSAPDLEDLTLEMDFAATDFVLTTDRWSSVIPFERTL